MKLWLDELAKSVMETEAKQRRFLETGGPLFGYESVDEDEIVVAAAFGPGPRARHRPRSLVPDRDATGRAIESVHQQSEGRYRYLGSWHTHPLGQPRPSGIDIATARDISSQIEVDLPRPVLLIQATRPTPRRVHLGGLSAFRWNPERTQMESVPIEVVAVDDRLVTSCVASEPAPDSADRPAE